MQIEKIQGFRLSPQQKRAWLFQAVTKKLTYQVKCSLLIEGHLQLEKLQQAWQNVINNHEILRTKYDCLSGMGIPLQVISERHEFTWEIMDLSHLEPENINFQVETIFTAIERQSHLCLLKLASQKHILIISLSPLCADAQSLRNLVTEISHAYFGISNLSSAEIMQYADFAEWQNELLAENDTAAVKNYWQNQDFSEAWKIQLPLEKLVAQADEFQPQAVVREFDCHTSSQIIILARECQTSLASFLLACWQVLIYRLTKQSNLVIGTVFAGRKYPELESAIGLMAKYIPVQSHLKASNSFTEILAATHNLQQEIYQWQEYFSWESTSLADAAFLPVGFEFKQNYPKIEKNGISFSLLQEYLCTEPFKIKLVCHQQDDTLVTEFHYDASLFTNDQIQRVAAQFKTLVMSILQHPNLAISDLEILSKTERQQILIDFNNTQLDFAPFQTIQQRFEQQVARTPNAIAIIYENEQLTYQQLNQRANQLAAYLQKLGVAPEVLVPIYLERSLKAIIALLGILKAGGAYVFSDSTIPSERLAFMLRDTQAQIVLTQQQLVENLPESTATVLCLDSDWSKIEQAWDEAFSPPADQNVNSIIKPTNLAYLVYTSGSTGKPKAVAIEHRQILNYLDGIGQKLNLEDGKSFALISTLAADLGNTVLFSALCTGGCLHLIPYELAADGEMLGQYFQKHPIDCLKITPSHLSALLLSSKPELILPRQILILGGEQLAWALVKKIQNLASPCRLFNHYGPTETTVGVLTYEVPKQQDNSDNFLAKTVALGTPLANTQVYILDDYLQPVPIGVTGEIYIGGNNLARGYLNQAKLTTQKFIPNPFSERERLYQTGDLARYLPDGNIEFLGRIDHQVKIRGFRIELGEIEGVLKQHSAIQQAVIMLRENVSGDQYLVGYIVINPQTPASITNSTDLHSFLKTKLPEYMVPSSFVFLKNLPLTGNGKVDREKLPRSEPITPSLAATLIAPRNHTEKAIAQIWRQLLNLEQVGIHDNFFDLGGHSLLTTMLMSQIRKTFQIDLPLRTLFNSPTVASLGTSIDVILQAKDSNVSTALNKVADIDLNQEAVLDPTIIPATNPFKLTTQPNAIFLTGATGFLGAFLLFELLKETQADIYCLVRSPNLELAKNRLQSCLESYLIWDQSFAQRIIPVIGDLSQPLLGLADIEFQKLAKQVEIIYHNGAFVHHLYPYSVLKAANVWGTQEILRLACQFKIKPVHFISTPNVFSSTGYSGIRIIKEQDNIDHEQISNDGYSQTKWVAEKLVKAASELGVPVYIYRPGRISPHSQTGVFNPHDFLHKLIVGCIQLGSVPNNSLKDNLVPVDYVSKAIIHLSRQIFAEVNSFHLLNSQPFNYSLLPEIIRSCGYSLKQIPYDHWRIKLLDIVSNSPEHSLYSLIPFFSAGEFEEETFESATLKFDCQNTLDGLAKTSLIYPPIDHQYLSPYFAYLTNNSIFNNI
jgi:amino acid adenylation domain-containing protein/thioester reductase-like protein